MDGSYVETIQWLVYEQVRRNHEAVERACELMLVMPGNRGVKVTELEGGAVRAELSDDVPFGEIHYDLHRPGISC